MNRKFAADRAGRFFITFDESPAAAPDLILSFQDKADVTETLAPFRASVAVTVDANSESLTVAAAGSADGLVGVDGGQCWLDLGDRGLYPVELLDVRSATSLILGEQLPIYLEGATGTLSWSRYYASLTAAQVGSGERNAIWSIAWEANLGSDRPTEYRLEEGRFDVVRRPFTTGLTHRKLIDRSSFLARAIPSRQASWDPQIKDALSQLAAWIRCPIPKDKTEDDVDGVPFQHVHALITIGIILQGQSIAGYDRDYAQTMVDAKAAFDQVVSCGFTWVDLDGDGVVDDGELAEGLNLMGAMGEVVCHVLEDDWVEEQAPYKRTLHEVR